MTYPTQFKINLPEAQIIEMSLRGSDFQLHLRRNFLREVGQCLVESSSGYITFIDESDVWFLRDRLDPALSVGDYTGLGLITRLYELLVGRTFNWASPIEFGDKNGNNNQDNPENTNAVCAKG